jgi:tetratricopeptide (TPR) repeat protein
MNQKAAPPGARSASRSSLTALALRCALVASALAPGAADAQVSALACGELTNSFGPFEYRMDRFVLPPGDPMPYRGKLAIVEREHFTPPVEALTRGQSSVEPGPDLDYTLRAFPNHHRALAALLRAAQRNTTPQPLGLPRPIECYFERALRFRADDTTARLLYAKFLLAKQRRPEALTQIAQATEYAKEMGFTHYNIGLLYLEAAEPAQALAAAHRAMQLGFPGGILRDRLVALGRWTEPPPAADAAAPPAVPAASAAGATTVAR